jgi:hypothetical protein
LTLLDTGPLVGLFDPRDPSHAACRRALQRLRGPLLVTVPVLTEAFHFLSPRSRGSAALRTFLLSGAVEPRFLDAAGMARALALMERYADAPMDFADASLVVAAEGSGTRRVLTLDRRHFATYRVTRGRRKDPFEIVEV